MVHPHIVVNSPPTHQGSVLSQCVEEIATSCLEILHEVQRASVFAELAALHKQQHLDQFLAMRADAAKRCTNAALRTSHSKHYPSAPEELDHFYTSVASGVGVGDSWRTCAPTTSLKAEANREKRFIALPVKLWADCAQRANPRKDETLDEYAARQKNDKSPVPHVFTNFCPHRKAYVAQDHTCPMVQHGKACVDHSKVDHVKLAADQVEKALNAWEKDIEFQKHATRFWQYCVEFEFPSVCAEQAKEEAAEQLMKHIPQGDLVALIRNAEMRGLLQGSYGKDELSTVVSVKGKGKPRGKRHYVRHGVEQLSFVRKQDLELATNV
jgi:hypothetical protein